MERIIRWIENNGVTCYQIFDVSKEKRSERLCTDVSGATTEFTKDYEILSDGKYFIKGMTNPKGDRGAVRMDFQIGSIITNNSFGGMTLEQVKAEAYAQARKDFEFETMMREFAEMKQTMKIIIQILKEKFDDDEGNDEHANKLIDTISSVKENYDGVKDLFSTLKF